MFRLSPLTNSSCHSAALFQFLPRIFFPTQGWAFGPDSHFLLSQTWEQNVYILRRRGKVKVKATRMKSFKWIHIFGIFIDNLLTHHVVYSFNDLTFKMLFLLIKELMQMNLYILRRRGKVWISYKDKILWMNVIFGTFWDDPRHAKACCLLI